MKSVFISSTFKDMQGERDLLHERIFPRLRKIIGEYGEDIQELDLRWGVDTIEMSEEESGHQVLRVCIDAIDRCRPYMIVLLGERYGWIPELSLVESLRDERVNAWYEKQMSITNLEIRYGALSEEETLKNCVFCFRDPKLISQIDETHRGIYDSESPMHREKLNVLKEQIRGKKNAVILDYQAGWDETEGRVCALEDFGEAVYELLVQMIRRDFAGQEAKNSMERLSFQMERIKEQYLSSYVVRYREEQYLLGRINYYDRLKGGILKDLDDYERIILKGGAGSGKSALMASMEQTLRKMGWETILYFSGNSGCQSLDVLKDFMIWRLEEICGLTHGEMSSRDERIRLLAEKTKDQKIYCFIDAVDQLFENQAGKRLDTLDLCPNLYYVLSSLSDFPVEESVKTYVRPFFVCRIEDFTMEQRRQMIGRTAAKRGKKLDDLITEMTVGEQGAGNPLYLSMLLQRYFMMDQREFEAAEAMAPGMDGLHRYVESLLREMPGEAEPMVTYLFQVTGQRFGLSWFREILQLLALSEFGLSEQELEGILSIGGMRFLQVEFQQLVSYLYDAFTLRENGKWTFAHRLFQESVLHGISKEEEEAVWNLLIDYSLHSPDFLEQEGFYYILKRRHPSGGLVLGQAEEWETKQQLLDFVGRLAVQEDSYRAYFLELISKTGADTLWNFWLSFEMDNYEPEFRDFLYRVWKIMSEKEGSSVRQKYVCTMKLAEYARWEQQDQNAMFCYLERAEFFCRNMPEPEKSRKLSNTYTKRAMWREKDRPGELETAEAEMNTAGQMLAPFLMTDEPAERMEVIRQDLSNKMNYAQMEGDYRGDYQVEVLEDCLKELAPYVENARNEEFERKQVDLYSMYAVAYQTRGHVDWEKSLSFGKKAMELSERLIGQFPSIKNLEQRMALIDDYAYCYQNGYQYPFREEYLLLARKIYDRYPTDYWKNWLAYASCAFGIAVDDAVINRAVVFPEELRTRGKKAWEEGVGFYEELLKNGYDQEKNRYNYRLFLNRKAAIREKYGYRKKAFADAKRSRDLFLESVRQKDRYSEREQGLRDADLVLARTLCEVCRVEEALPYAEEGLQSALRYQEKAGRIYQKTAECWLVYTRLLYYLRKDEEALAACQETEKIYQNLSESDEKKKVCGELAYIRSRILLEQRKLSEAETYRHAFEESCVSGKDSWEYGQSLILKADFLMAEGKTELAEAAYDEACSFWESRSRTEEKQVKNWSQYYVYEENGYIYRRPCRAESGYYLKAVYYRLYSLYKRIQFNGNWSETLVTRYVHTYDDSRRTAYGELIWLPAYFPAFARLNSVIPVRERIHLISLIKLQEERQICFSDQAEDIAGRGEKNPKLCRQMLMEIEQLYQQLMHSYSRYLELLVAGKEFAGQFQLDGKSPEESAVLSPEQRYLFAEKRLKSVRVWYPMLRLCGIAYRSRTYLENEDLDTLYQLSRGCFINAGWYENQNGEFSEKRSWDISPLSEEVLELLFAALGDEEEKNSVHISYRRAKNAIALELFRRTGEKTYIRDRFSDMMQTDAYLKGENPRREPEKDRRELAEDVSDFLTETLKYNGRSWAAEIFGFIQEYEERGLLEKTEYDDALRKAFLTSLNEKTPEGALLREQAEALWEKGYRSMWEKKKYSLAGR